MGQRRGTVVVYEDYVCPFCYLAEAPLAPLARLRADGVVVERGAFELRPAPERLADVRDPWYREEWDQSVLPLADQLGVEIRFPARSVRTRKAHEAAAFARSHGRLEEVHAAIFRAHFVDGRDIGRIDVLAELGAAAGLDASELRVQLDADRWTEQVEQDEAAAAALGILAVPAFVRGSAAAGFETMLGVRDYGTLRQWVQGVSRTERGP